MLRHATPLLLLLALAGPTGAQDSFGVGGSGGSIATVTTTRSPPGFADEFAGANVLSGVNIRATPESGAPILGTLQPGGTVLARCQRGWCQLQDGGYVGQRFLSFDASDSFEVAPPATTEATLDTTTILDAPQGSPSTLSLAPPAAPDGVAGTFDGTWVVTSDPTQQEVPLTLAQSGNAVTGTLKSDKRTTTLTGEVQGTQLTFTYQMADAKGKAVASGNGYLTLGKQGQSLKGVLMLNGLVVANLDARR